MVIFIYSYTVHYVRTFPSAGYDFAPLRGLLPDTKCKDSDSYSQIKVEICRRFPNLFAVK